jgi:hypothetical protein
MPEGRMGKFTAKDFRIRIIFHTMTGNYEQWNGKFTLFIF